MRPVPVRHRVDPGWLAFAALVTGGLFALMCHSYRVEVLAHPGRTRSLSRTSLRTLRVIASLTTFMVLLAIAEQYWHLEAWHDEAQSVVKAWMAIAWTVTAFVNRPTRRERDA